MEKKLNTEQETPKPKGAPSSKNYFKMPYSQIWRSRISWKIISCALFTMVIALCCILAFIVPRFEKTYLEQLEAEGLLAVVAAIDHGVKLKDSKSPISEQSASVLFSQTPISGLSVYTLDMELLASFGETPQAPTTDLKTVTPQNTLNASKSSFETVYLSEAIGRPFRVVTKIQSANLSRSLQDFVLGIILTSLLLSVFVTSILILAIGRWLLEPIVLVRNNLIAAAKQPENPDIQYPRKETSDEVGVALRIANDLIKQNALNLNRLRSQAEDRIHKLAYFDRLTNLPNRTMFLDKLDEYIKTFVIKEGNRLAVLTIDLDQFKDVNDTMGHEIGDKVLEAVAHRFVHTMPENALISRASADEFNIMIPLSDNDRHKDFVNMIFTALEEPISIYQESFQIGASVGVSHSPDDGIEAGKLLKNADIALNRSKEEGRNTARYYSEDFDKAVQKRFQMLRDLRIALDEGQFQLHYQPQFDLHTGKMIGAEALLRWFKPDNSKEGGHFISPAEFIPVSEQSGLIVPLGEWVLQTACRDCKDWHEQGHNIRIAVNISGVQFHRSNLMRIVSDIIQDTKIDPKFLELEVTESIFMDDVESTIAILNKLHQLGIELAIDDFGTGYSSLSYLRQFPIDRLKIDQSFTRNALSNPDDMAITKTIISLGHSLGLNVIAEGVETQEHENFLKQEGCDEVQGFKYSKGLPNNELIQFMRTYADDLSPPSKLTTVK